MLDWAKGRLFLTLRYDLIAVLYFIEFKQVCFIGIIPNPLRYLWSKDNLKSGPLSDAISNYALFIN